MNRDFTPFQILKEIGDALLKLSVFGKPVKLSKRTNSGLNGTRAEQFNRSMILVRDLTRLESMAKNTCTGISGDLLRELKGALDQWPNGLLGLSSVDLKSLQGLSGRFFAEASRIRAAKIGGNVEPDSYAVHEPKALSELLQEVFDAIPIAPDGREGSEIVAMINRPVTDRLGVIKAIAKLQKLRPESNIRNVRGRGYMRDE